MYLDGVDSELPVMPAILELRRPQVLAHLVFCPYLQPRTPLQHHLLLALGSAAVDVRHRVRYYSAAELIDTLYRGRADNTVGKIVDDLLRNDLVILDELSFGPLDDTSASAAVPVRRGYERRSLASARIGRSSPGRFLPEHHRSQHARPAPPPLPRREWEPSPVHNPKQVERHGCCCTSLLY
jgi:IstB-like ATP binding protein